ASLGPIYEMKLTEAMTLELPEETPGQLAPQAGALILHYAEKCQALGLGPGLGLNPGARATVFEVIKKAPCPLVLDADALSHVAKNLDILKNRNGPTVLTPHPGEAARLAQKSVSEIQHNRLLSAQNLAQETNAIVVLKGHNTVIAAPDGEYFINTTGGPHMATGGSGDLLTGLLTGLLAQKVPPLASAALAAWLHGRAADMACAQKGKIGLCPSEFQAFIPMAFEQLANN
ncbi:MAG: NAD(P)H-hydrate dehydratase, partial [Candidatus Adiutrix sp.]